VQTLEEARDAMPMNWLVRSAARTFGAFGAIALFMAAVGLYGVKAYLVAQRTREIGIRLAIGAGAGDVIRMVVRDGAVLLAASVAAGLVLALGAGKAVSSLLVGVQPFDPLVLAVATAVLSAAVLGACYVPARRATRVSPVTALRVE
jgi:putative ABC transport system permease protein